MKNKPDYQRIYTDIINKKFPHLKVELFTVLSKKDWSVLDILDANRKISQIAANKSEKFNQRHRAYKKADIFEILNYQKYHKLNNSQVAKHFNVSRNTIAKWKKIDSEIMSID